MPDSKVLRVVGLASAANLDRADPFNPINRRISIIVMNKRTEEAVVRDGAKLEVSDAASAAALPESVPAAMPAPARVVK
jgi:chemotaxis protein MotB